MSAEPRIYGERPELTEATELAKRRINYWLGRAFPGRDLRDDFELTPALLTQESMSGCTTYQLRVWAVLVDGEPHGHIRRRRSGKTAYERWFKGTPNETPDPAIYPQLSTCKWCKRVIRRTGPEAKWTSAQLAGLSPNPECPKAPNPTDGPMPGHEPGTAVLSPPRPEASPYIDPDTLPRVVIPNIPRI